MIKTFLIGVALALSSVSAQANGLKDLENFLRRMDAFRRAEVAA